MSNLAARANALKAKAVEVSFKDVDAPDTSSDILKMFETNTGIKSESANEWIIDVFPNFMPIISYIMLLVRRFALADNARIHPKVSTPTVALYYLSIIYGFFLCSDCYLRPTPSVYARLWKESSWRNDFMDFLMTLPVPEDLLPLLAQFFPSETERSKNVFFTPSAAGFSWKYFLGRYLPLNFFSILHDAASQLPGNSNRVTVMSHVISQPVIQFLAPANANTVHMATFLGYSIDQTTGTTANYINSKFHQIFTSVFNPVLFRDYQRRSTLAEIGLSQSKFKVNEPNAYDVLFAASSPNLAELKVVLSTVSSFLSGNVKCTKSLGQVLSSISGIEIISHGYSEFALPIHSLNPTKSGTDLAAVTTLTRVEFIDRAQDFSFLDVSAARPDANTDVFDVKYIKNDDNTEARIPTGYSILHYWPFSLIHITTQTARFPTFTRDSTDVVIFNEDFHVTPTVLLLDIENQASAASVLPLLCGKIIESFELDGTTIEIPNRFKALGMQNTLFADSAIPYVYTVQSIHWHPQAQGTIRPPLARAKADSTRSLPASSLLHDRTKVYLPAVPDAAYTATHYRSHIIDNPAPGALPGFEARANADWLRYVQSFLGFRTVDPSGKRPDSDQIPNMEEDRLYVWSPYSYNSYVDSDDVTPDYSASKHYFITNLRTLFGTDYNLVECKHPFEALPVS